MQRRLNYCKEYYWKNREKLLARSKAFQKKNRGKIAKKEKEYRIKNSRKINARRRTYYAKNKERINALRKRYQNGRHLIFKEKVFDLFGRKCVFCGITDERVLTIDHINGGGYKHRKSLNGNIPQYYKEIFEEPTKYRILCRNCNWLEYIKTKTIA